MKIKNPGNDLLSRELAVPSAKKSLTSVFGMMTGVSSFLESPGCFKEDKNMVKDSGN